MPSSTLLVVCLFLPFMTVCGKATLALEWPMFYTPYAIGGLVFAAALSRPRAFWALALALRIIIWLTVAVWAWIAMVAASEHVNGWLIVSCLCVAGLVAAVFTRGPSEAVIARCGTVAGAASTAWFIAVATSTGGLYGAGVAAVAASVMAVGCAWWWFEVTSETRTSG